MIPATTRPRHAAALRAALAFAALLGVFLIVFPLAISLPDKSAASGDLMNAMRPQMSDAALAQGRADQQTVQAMGNELTGKLMPTLAAQLKLSADQVNAYFGQNLPAMARGMAELPTLQSRFGGLQATMEQQQSNFRQADQIPTSFMPPTTMTMLFVIPGAILVLLAGYGLWRPMRARAMVAGTAITGIVMAAGLLATSMYGKATSADEMTAAFKPIFAAQAVQQTRALTNDASAMADELTTKAMPTLAAALKVTPDQLAGSMATSYPAVVSGMQKLPAIIGRMQVATALIEAQQGNFTKTAAIPWEPGSMAGVFWSMMAPALLVIAVGTGVLYAAGGQGLTEPHRRRATLRPGALHR